MNEENNKKDFTQDDFSDFMSSLQKMSEKETGRPFDWEGHKRYMDLIGPHLHKTKEEMERDIPDGSYELSGGIFTVWTGKGGLIMSILAMQEELNKYKNEYKVD